MCSHKQMGSSRRPDSLAAVSDQVEQTSECLFCAIVAGTAPCAKVAEDPSTFAFMDIDPGSDGHLLVVPKRHITDCSTFRPTTSSPPRCQRIARATLSALGAEGVNLFNCSGVDAWQTVFHFHMHVIPRYRDRGRDRMELPFKPGRPADVEAIAERAMVLAAAL